jgi:hypothetical protein
MLSVGRLWWAKVGKAAQSSVSETPYKRKRIENTREFLLEKWIFAKLL